MTDNPVSLSESGYPLTQWNIIHLASTGTEDQKKAALESLCRAYWQPLYTFLRCAGRNHEAAEDGVQEFFLRLMDGRLLSLADPGKGRFRTLILTALRNLDCDFRRIENCQKRGGAVETVSLDFALAEESWQLELAYSTSPEKTFDRVWALTLISRATRRLKRHFAEDGKTALFEELFPRITGEMEQETLASLAQRLGMSEAAVKMASFRLRRHYAEAIRDEIQLTVSSPEDVNDELRSLMSSLS